ncbi:MAG: hypothetical protein P0Y64_16895 [Candidatus Sphingomonas colombiensis]|nr:hypothetical protein [Sphingomonas sp.]WEK42997.1 MAG: hypothetical protein P0Y64_16895 [Sphingomonas sp.]
MIRRDVTRGALAFLLLGAFSIALFVMFWRTIPEGNRETLTYMLGQLSGMVTTALAFYYSSSKSSADRNDITAKALDTVAAGIAAGPAVSAPDEPEARP